MQRHNLSVFTAFPAKISALSAMNSSSKASSFGQKIFPLSTRIGEQDRTAVRDYEIRRTQQAVSLRGRDNLPFHQRRVHPVRVAGLPQLLAQGSLQGMAGGAQIEGQHVSGSNQRPVRRRHLY